MEVNRKGTEQRKRNGTRKRMIEVSMETGNVKEEKKQTKKKERN
jgi:hypothetical protein